MVTRRIAESIVIPSQHPTAAHEGEPISGNLDHAPAGAAEARIDAENAKFRRVTPRMVIDPRPAAGKAHRSVSPTRQRQPAMLSIRPQCRDDNRKSAEPLSLAARCRGCSAPRSCARSAGTAMSTSVPAASSSDAAPASPRTPNSWRRWRRAVPVLATSVSKFPKRFAIDRRPPHHRGAAAAPSSDLVGSAATAPARHHRSRALPSRLGRSSASNRMAAACAFISTAAASNTPKSSSAATASAPRCAAGRPGAAADQCRLLHLRGSPNEADLAPQVLKKPLPLVFYLPPRQEVITYPIAGFNDDLRPGHRRFNFIWYRVTRRGPTARDERSFKRACTTRILRCHRRSSAKINRRDAGRRARDHAARAARLRHEDQAAVHHADLRFHRAPHRVRASRHGRRRGRQRAAAYGLRRRQGRRRRRGARRGAAATTISTRRSKPTTPHVSRLATPSSCTAASSAPTWAST